MPLSKKLKIQNCVIVANGLNPSIFTQYWFIKNEILSEGELSPNSIFSRDLVQLETTSKVRLLIFPTQLQCFVEEGENLQTAINNFIIPLVTKIGSFSYLAAGINYSWFLSDPNSNLAELSSKLFKNDRLPVSKLFSDQEDANFGIYLSKNVASCRLKLDIKPARAIELGLSEQLEMILCAFNFHKDLGGTNFNQQELIEHLKQGPIFKAEADKIIGVFN